MNLLESPVCRRTHLYHTGGVASKVKVAKHKVRRDAVLLVGVEALHGVDECATPALAVDGRKFFAGRQIRGVMEQMDVD